MSASTLNHPDAHETFVLAADGSEKKIVSEPDPKIMNAATFTIAKEDHTIGNLLVAQLLRDPRVLYAGYRIPHPLENILVVKVQVKEGCTPQEALETAIDDCIAAIASFGTQFGEECQRIKMGDNAQNEDYAGI